jgi:parvulin-like peptidyl-prolyl isomerase
MIGSIRKHSKVLWWIVIVAIIITFVWWGSSTSRVDTSRSDGNYGIMNGLVITPTLFESAAREVRLNYFYSSGGTWPGGGRATPNFDLEREVYQRLLLIQKMEELGIHVSDDAVAQAAGARMRAVNRGNPVPVTEFETQLLGPQRLNFGDFERYIRHDLGIQQLLMVAGAGGDLVTPQEIEALYRRDYQQILTQVVFFQGSNDLATIAITPEKIGEFYTNRQAYYRLPERVQVNYVSFPLSNYLALAQKEMDQITNLTEIIEARYEQVGTNYFSEAKSPAEAKEKIRAEFLKQAAVSAAAKEASKLDGLLYDKDPFTPETFATVTKELGLTARVSSPFSREEPPAELDVNADFVRRAFNLTAEEPLTEPLLGENHVYVIAYLRRLPSENPPFETIRARVTQDFRFVEAAMKAQQAGLAFHALATNGLAAGKSFADLCAEAKVKPIALAPFAMSSREVPEVENRLNVQSFKQVAFATAPGKVGELLPSADGAALVYVQERLPIDETAMRTNLPAFTRSVHQVRRNEVFNQWFSAEANKAFATIPYFQPKPALSGAPAAKQ